MDKVVTKLVGLGVPGLVLLVVIALNGLAGGAAIVAALAALGGPFGMLGGLATLGIMGLVANSIADYGVEAIFSRVVEGLIKEKKMSKKEIRSKIESYPISKSLKRAIFEQLDKA